MFNGIIKFTGKIVKVITKNNNCNIEVKSKMKFKNNEIGSSICCSGACLTIEKIKKGTIQFYLSKETLSKTTFKNVKIGDIINLEKSMKFGERISGHFVQGHVDTTSLINKINFVGKSWIINFKIKSTYKKYIISKGSITINGVSLTISKILKNSFNIAVIPQTLKLTNLMLLKEKDFVNVEFDIMGKYIKNINI